MGAYHRLSKAFKEAKVLPLSEECKYILISDCHRGNGTSADNFLKNQNLYFAALEYYYRKGFTYIELGDGDELWENRNMAQITEIHSNTFWLLEKYCDERRMYMIYGNHDMTKKGKEHIYEGVILKDCEEKRDIYLTHGHQADFFNCCMWRVSRFLVRYLWKPMENTGVLDPTSAAKNNTKKKRIENILTEWAHRENVFLITGHTHRPMIGTKDSPYFNTGSCVHPRCITGIEIENRCMKLIKWTLRTRKDRTLYVAREELEEYFL